MKKLMLIVAACAAMVACKQSGKTAENMNGNDSVTDSVVVDSMVYEGTLPAADGPGIRYNLALAGDSTNGYHLTMTYLEAENGKDKAFDYNGVAEIVTKTVGGKEKKAYKFSLGEKEAPAYFMIVDDSTLRAVNDQLEEAVTKGLNYDLKLKK